MYIPAVFAETRTDVLHEFMRAHDFVTLVTHGSSGLNVSHVPALLLPDRGELGSLQVHLARPNEHCRELAAGAASLAIFHGPHGYISPTWYINPANVPTWNYVVVHAHAIPRPLSDDELRQYLHALVARYESDRADPWSPERLTPDFFEQRQRAIVGFELGITRLEGKWKLGQNRTAADRDGAIAGLRAAGDLDSATLARWMSDAAGLRS